MFLSNLADAAGDVGSLPGHGVVLRRQVHVVALHHRPGACNKGQDGVTALEVFSVLFTVVSGGPDGVVVVGRVGVVEQGRALVAGLLSGIHGGLQNAISGCGPPGGGGGRGVGGGGRGPLFLRRSLAVVVPQVEWPDGED